MIPKAYTIEEFLRFFTKKKYKSFEDFNRNAYHRDHVVAVGVHPSRWKGEWGSAEYIILDFDSDDFVEKSGFLCCDGDFNFTALRHYQYYVEEFIYGIRTVRFNVVAIISYWEGMCKVYNDLLRSRDAGGLGLKDLLKDFEPLDIKNDRNQELCRMALAEERSDHKYPECDKRLRFSECKILGPPHPKCLEILDENECPMHKVWKDRKI